MPMMITIARHPDVSADVVVDADPHTVLREVVRELLAGVAPVPLGKTELPEVYLGAQRLDLDQPFGGSGIHDGSVLWLDQPGKGTRKRAGLVTVRAVAGTGAGQVWNLDAGEHRIGSHGSCQVRLGSDQPSEAAVIRVLLDATVQLSASVEGPLLDRAPCRDTRSPGSHGPNSGAVTRSWRRSPSSARTPSSTPPRTASTWTTTARRGCSRPPSAPSSVSPPSPRPRRRAHCRGSPPPCPRCSAG